jgi:RimJ/RimL family protein N-acetyltransferase
MTADDDLHLRPAEPSDARDVWAWRNDAESRAASRGTEPVTWEVHEAWFARVLEDPARTMLVGCDPQTGEKVGMVRFDPPGPDGERLVSVNIAPERRGRGFGEKLLAAALAREGAGRVIAEVRRDNIVSVRLFQALGFRRRAEGEDFVVFERLQEA